MDVATALELGQTADLEDVYGPIILDIALDQDLIEEANTELTTAWMADWPAIDAEAALNLEAQAIDILGL
jgi:hypothetical protein